MSVSRRKFLEFLGAATATATIPSLDGLSAIAAESTTRPVTPDPSILSASKWSELPELLEQYEKITDAKTNGTSRIFGYASIIDNHKNEKPQGSQDIANEHARLPGMEVAMNVLAAGEFEFRGTRGKYIDKLGKEKRFANVGVYAGLEPAAGKDGFGDGIAVTASRQDREASLKSYIERELGKPPEGVTLDELFTEDGRKKFVALKGKPEDEFGMYKFQVVNLELDDKSKVPAVTVSTNEKSKFAAIGLTPMQTAQMVLDGQGYKRHTGASMVGGSSLDYFKNSAIGTVRKHKLIQPRLEAIDKAVDELAQVYSQVNDVIANKPPEQHYEEFKKIIDAHPHLTENGGIFSPYFYDGQNVNKRDAVSAEDLAVPENQGMPHTADEKLRRIHTLAQDGKTGPTP
jgi:hypothetical protein